jgi:hypothetical protein
MKWSVLQLSPPSYPQNRRSLSKSVLAGFHGLGTHEESMETQFETVIGVAKNRLRLGVVDVALWNFTNSSSFKTIWISHEFWVHGIQLVLISGVSFYFAKKTGEIIEVQIIQSLYWPFILLTVSSILMTKYFLFSASTMIVPFYLTGAEKMKTKKTSALIAKVSTLAKCFEDDEIDRVEHLERLSLLYIFLC